jgi:Predicted NADH:ubiquinone oxidoreductase, subunit RnfD
MKKTGWIISPAPFLYTRPTVSSMSLATGLCLVPQVLMLIAVNDTKALLNLVLALSGSIIAELCSSLPSRRNVIGDGTIVLSGLLVGLLLPVTLSPWIAFASSFSGVLVARVLFGGSGAYWMNPVAVAVGIAYISKPALFPPILVTADGIRTVGDAFGALRMDSFNLMDQDQSITGGMNQFFLSFLGIKLPEGYITLFWNSPSVIPAFRYNILTLGASLFLIALNIIDWIQPLMFLLVYSLAVGFLSLLPFGPSFFAGDMLFGLLTSGMLFIAFFVLPDFSTNPRTRVGKMISGIVSGLLAFSICGPGGSPVGGIFTIILINIINPVIEYSENRYIASAGDIS